MLPKKETDVCQLSRVLGITSAVAFSILLITTLNTLNMNVFQLMNSGYRLGNLNENVTAFDFFYNANDLGYLCNLTISALSILFYYKRGTIFDGAIIAFMVFIGALTVSRTFLVLLAMTIVLFICLQNVSFLKRIKSIFLLAFVAFVALLVVYAIFPEIILNYLKRFSVEDISNGRDFLFDFYNQFIFSSLERLFFGIGIQDIASKMYMFENAIVLVPHNGYQELLVAWGIFGFALMTFFMVGILVHARRKAGKNKVTWIHYLPLLILLVNILAGQFFTASYRVLTLLYCYELMSSKTFK